MPSPQLCSNWPMGRPSALTITVIPLSNQRGALVGWPQRARRTAASVSWSTGGPRSRQQWKRASSRIASEAALMG